MARETLGSLRIQLIDANGKKQEYEDRNLDLDDIIKHLEEKIHKLQECIRVLIG